MANKKSAINLMAIYFVKFSRPETLHIRANSITSLRSLAMQHPYNPEVSDRCQRSLLTSILFHALVSVPWHLTLAQPAWLEQRDFRSQLKDELKKQKDKRMFAPANARNSPW